MSVSALPIFNLGDMPSALRQLANRIEAGHFDATRAVVVLEKSDGGIDYKAFGAEYPSRAHAIGLCFACAQHIATEAA